MSSAIYGVIVTTFIRYWSHYSSIFVCSVCVFSDTLADFLKKSFLRDPN